MRSLKNRSISFYLCFGLLLAMALVGSTFVYADSGKVTATVKAGSLTLLRYTNQMSVYVNKKEKSVTYSLPVLLFDARGSGSGWNLTITSTRFTTNDKDEDKLPANASSMTGVNVSCLVNSTCTKPANSVSYPLGVPAGDMPPPPVKFFDAAVSSGLGNFVLMMMVQVNLPHNTKAGTYTCIVLLSVVAGP